MIDLDAIERRANAATPGPWAVYEKPDPWGYWAVQDADGKDVFDDGSAGAEYGQTCSIADRDFLVAARTDVPAPIAYIEELERERDEARAQLAAADTGAPCDGHRHCCADRRKLAEELLRVRAERDALRSSLARKIRHCEEITEERDALKGKP